MQPVQDLTVEDRVSRTQYQYTLQVTDADRTEHVGADKLLERIKQICRTCSDR